MAITVNEASAVLREAVRDSIRRRSLLYLIQGGLLALAGVLALVFPLIFGAGVLVLIGWLLVLSGVVQAVGLIGATKVPVLLAAARLGRARRGGRLPADLPPRGGPARRRAAPGRLLHDRGGVAHRLRPDDPPDGRLAVPARAAASSASSWRSSSRPISEGPPSGCSAPWSGSIWSPPAARSATSPGTCAARSPDAAERTSRARILPDAAQREERHGQGNRHRDPPRACRLRPGRARGAASAAGSGRDRAGRRAVRRRRGPHPGARRQPVRSAGRGRLRTPRAPAFAPPSPPRRTSRSRASARPAGRSRCAAPRTGSAAHGWRSPSCGARTGSPAGRRSASGSAAAAAPTSRSVASGAEAGAPARRPSR